MYITVLQKHSFPFSHSFLSRFLFLTMYLFLWRVIGSTYMQCFAIKDFYKKYYIQCIQAFVSAVKNFPSQLLHFVSLPYNGRRINRSHFYLASEGEREGRRKGGLTRIVEHTNVFNCYYLGGIRLLSSTSALVLCEGNENVRSSFNRDIVTYYIRTGRIYVFLDFS